MGEFRDFFDQHVMIVPVGFEDDDSECEGHPDDGQFNGPAGETFYCDGSCRKGAK